MALTTNRRSVTAMANMVAEENLLILDDGFVLLSERAPRDLPIILPLDRKRG